MSETDINWMRCPCWKLSQRRSCRTSWFCRRRLRRPWLIARTCALCTQPCFTPHTDLYLGLFVLPLKNKTLLLTMEVFSTAMSSLIDCTHVRLFDLSRRRDARRASTIPPEGSQHMPPFHFVRCPYRLSTKIYYDASDTGMINELLDSFIYSSGSC